MKNKFFTAHYGYQPISDPSTKEVHFKPPNTGSNAVKPDYIPAPSIKVNSNEITLTFKEYNDLLSKIYFLEERNKCLQAQLCELVLERNKWIKNKFCKHKKRCR